MRTLITILDGITQTSMPFNEFVLYRASHMKHEKQVLICLCGRRNLSEFNIPDSLDIRFAGRKISRIRKVIKQAVKEAEDRGDHYAVHLHQVQSGFLAQIAMIGTGMRKKTLFTVHSTFSGYQFHNKFLSFTNALFANRITCVSNTSYNDYPKIIRNIKKDRITALQNGVDTERIDAVLEGVQRENDGDTVDFIYVARLIPLKNHFFLTKVLAKVKGNVRFIFVGAEDKDYDVRKKAEEEGVRDRILFTGLLPRDEVYRRLYNADVYISSSTLEGLPISVLEAMYCGLPCILSDIPQHRETAGEAAAILGNDMDAWGSEIDRLASLTAEQRAELGRKAREHVKKNFSLQAMHEKYDSIYEKLY